MLTMRYQRLTRRYVAVMATHTPTEHSIDDLLRGGRTTVVVAPSRWRPAADLYETDSTFCVTVELAGIEPESVEVLLYEDALIVQGHRLPAACEPGGVYHMAQIRHGPFRLEMPLPSSVLGTAEPEAHYEQGLLRITLPKES
jgi:HSP20 family protein